jgi:phage terminase large subunit
MNTSSVFSKNLYAYAILGKRIIVNSGGTSSTKTYSIIQLLILIALSSAVPLIISIVSESVPHLKRGTIRDFQNILAENYDANRYNLTDRIYVFPNGSILEFFSADDPARLRGGRRDILFINECNNLSKNAFDELDVRTRKCTFLDFNPVSEFWALAAIESRRSDPNWWRIYGEGLVGCIEGLVHSTFTTVDALPPHDSCIYGLDFGFSQDPTCLTRNVFVGKNIYSDCLIYETGLTNDKIVARFQSLGLRPGYDEIYADSADPKSIAEIREAGYNVKPVVKGADSLITGIQKVNQYTQHWTKTSVDAIKEQRNYRYIEDRDGKLTNKPTDAWNHAMDSRRYAVMSKLRQQTKFLKIAV